MTQQPTGCINRHPTRRSCPMRIKIYSTSFVLLNRVAPPCKETRYLTPEIIHAIISSRLYNFLAVSHLVKIVARGYDCVDEYSGQLEISSQSSPTPFNFSVAAVRFAYLRIIARWLRNTCRGPTGTNPRPVTRYFSNNPLITLAETQSRVARYSKYSKFYLSMNGKSAREAESVASGDCQEIWSG